MAQDATLSPSTVDAFVSAPEDKQREALGKMSVPAKTALLTALKARKTANPAPAAPATPAVPAPQPNPLITSNEGQYQMKDKSGKVVPVSYSHVLDAIHSGHNFVDRQNLAQFARDHAADPNNAEHRSDATIAAMSNWNPLKYLASIGAGVMDPLIGVGGEVLKVATAFDKPANSEFETNLQIAAETPAEGVIQKTGAVGEQIGELFAVPETDIAKAAKIPKLAKATLTVLEQGVRAAAEQGGQTYVHSGGDSDATKSAAETGGAFGAATPIAGAVLKALGSFGSDVGRFFLKVGDMQTGAMTRDTEAANKDIAERAAEIRKSNAEEVAQAEKDHEAAVEKAKAVYDQKVKNANAPTERAQAANEFKEQQAQLDHEHAVEKARLDHQQAVAAQQESEAKAAIARRAELATRSRLAARLQTIRDAAVAYFKKNYKEVEDVVNKADPDTGEPHLDESNSVPISDLADAVSDSRKHIQGSDESIKVFNDITKKIQGVGKAEKASGLGPEELSSLAPDELAALHKEGGAPQNIGFSDLKGYYSELGRQLASESVPGDVKQAIVALRDKIDDMQQKLANDAGVGVRYRLLRDQYRNYARGFLDYQGPNGEASPVARAVRKNDAFNATKDFPKMEPEELSHTKQILAGKPTDAGTQFVEGDIETQGGKKIPAWKYRRDTTKLLDNFIAASNKADDAEKGIGKPVGEFVPPEFKPAKPSMVPEPKDVGEFKPPDAKPPKLEEEPEKIVRTPEDVRKLKEDNLLNRASLLNHFGTYMAISGLVGSVFALTGGDPAERVKRGAEGVLVGAVSPYLMARIVERPDVIKALTAVTRKDLDRLMKLPADQRAGVEEGIKQLADAAIKKGKLKASQIPWLRIVGGTIAKNATQPAPQESNAGESEQDIEKDLNDMQNQVSR